MKVIAPGSRVRLVLGEIEAAVVAVEIRSGPTARYFVEHWDGGVCHFDWIEATSVEPMAGSESLKIGFVE